MLLHAGLMELPAADPACVFCDIVAGAVRASRVYEDAKVRWHERSREDLDDDAAQVRAGLVRSGYRPG